MGTYAFTADYTAATRTLTVAGEIDLLSADTFRDAIATATSEFSQPATIDLNAVRYCSSHAVRVILEAIDNVNLRIVASEDSIVHRVLDTYGIDHDSPPSD